MQDKIPLPRRITVLDTTLREGDQAAGFAFTPEDKMRLGRALAAAGVDIIETGFPCSGPGDFAVCRALARELAESGWRGTTAVMCRGRAEDIAESAKVFEGGLDGVLHISLPVSRVHIEAKLGISAGELLALAWDAVTLAAGLVSRVELGAEDASRADPGFLAEYCGAAFAAGAAAVNIADTMGLFHPPEMTELISFLMTKVPALTEGKGVLSVHCHNDGGLALANTLAAIGAGCNQIEVSASGTGERAGNAGLEEVAAAIAGKERLYGKTGIVIQQLPPLTLLAAEISGVPGGPFKPYTGWNIRAHGSGIHQQGLAKDERTYNPPGLDAVTGAKERIVLSRHSGAAGAALFCARWFGFTPPPETLAACMERIKTGPRFASGAVGISEFLEILRDLEKLPSEYAGPYRLASFTIEKNDASAVFSAGFMQGNNTETAPFRGAAETGPAAVMDCLTRFWRSLTSPDAPALILKRLSLCAEGPRTRLYVEIDLGRRLYPLERTGSEPQEILLANCCLDCINGEMVRELLINLNF